MKPAAYLALLGLSGLSTATIHQLHTRDGARNDYYTLELDPSVATPEQVAGRLGLRWEGQLGQMRDVHIFSAPKSDTEDIVDLKVKAHRRRRSVGLDTLNAIGNYHKQKLRRPWVKRSVPEGPKVHGPRQQPVQAVQEKFDSVVKTLGINDPIFNEQWHLINMVQEGHDVNVTDVWLDGITGKNTTVAIVDDGLDMYSDDLKDNYYAAGSWDFNDNGPEPKPRLSDDKHGTRCAGEVSAVRNDVCGVGVAYDSKIAGLRILSKMITDEDEAVALNYDYAHNQIYSCSWGPPDDGRSMDAPSWIIRKAMLNGVQNGRQGLGSIFVFASGNGAAYEDNCNFDGYTNSIYSITVGAIDREGNHPYYSEKCSAQLVVAYSSGGGDYIHTTDVGTNVCATGHGGTSAAAPLGAGIIALALQVRPDLTWRDMQYIVLESAVPVDLDKPELAWKKTAIGKMYSHSFGYGKLDAWRLVDAARSWKNVKPQSWYFSPWVHVNQDIPQGDQGLAVKLEVTEQMLKDANLERLEHVTLTMNAKHDKRGDLSVDLISPEGIVSHLSTTRKYDNAATGYDDWTFMSVVHWGEKGIGTWTVVIKDSKVNEQKGKLIDFHLKLWGEAIDANKATLLPVPSENEDEDHTVIPTTTATGTTTSVTYPTQTGTVTENPSDHPNRPTKPTGADAGGSTTTSEPQETETSEAETSNAANGSWIPSFLPTFGASPHTAAWIYGSLALIVVFCSCLGIWLWLQRRKRLRNSERSDYEFELLNDEEAEALNSGEKVAGKKRRTRGGELYDAFADGSDDEEFHDDASASGSGSGGGYETREKRDSEEQHVIGDESDESDEDDDDNDERPAGGARGALLGKSS